jgi:hypothetical protein
MIVDIPHSTQPFHKDPEWNNWLTFISSLDDPATFLHDLMTDHLLKKRFKAFLEASIADEKRLQKALEGQATKASLPPRHIPIRPKGDYRFNDRYGNWEGLVEALCNDYPDIRSFHKQLRFSKAFRKDLRDFLNDAFAYENKLANQYMRGQ